MSADLALDSWALLALLQAEQPAADHVATMLDERDCVVSWANLAEVQYVIARERGSQAARQAVELLVDTLWRAEVVDGDVANLAAEVKVSHAMAFADALAVGTALVHGVPLVTGDPELLVAGATWETVDLRG